MWKEFEVSPLGRATSTESQTDPLTYSRRALGPKFSERVGLADYWLSTCPKSRAPCRMRSMRMPWSSTVKKMT